MSRKRQKREVPNPQVKLLQPPLNQGIEPKHFLKFTDLLGQQLPIISVVPTLLQ